MCKNLWLLLFLVGGTLTPSFAQPQAGPWMDLLEDNGKKHWRSSHANGFPPQGWHVEQGTLIVNGRPGAIRGGSLVTKHSFASFELAFEFNFSKGANSGIKYLLKQYPDGAWLGCEYQIIDDFENKDVAEDPDGRRKTAGLYELFEAQNPVLQPHGQWNTGKIIVSGPVIEHWLNGTKVFTCDRTSTAFLKAKFGSKFRSLADFGRVERGPLMLQDHGDQVSFRNVRIRELVQPYEAQPVHQDEAFTQDYAIKYPYEDENGQARRIACDRNGRVQVLTTTDLLSPTDGQFQYPGRLMPDRRYQAMAKKQIRDMATYQGEFVYLDETAVFSNAFAGQLYLKHNLPSANRLCVGANAFLVSDGHVHTLMNDTGEQWTAKTPAGHLRDVIFDADRNCFWLAAGDGVYQLSQEGGRLEKLLSQRNITCLTLHDGLLAIGTHQGYGIVDPSSPVLKDVHTDLPHAVITTISSIGGQLWMGGPEGAFCETSAGKFNYYRGKRWLPGNAVQAIVTGSEDEVLVLTDQGLAKIRFEQMTLHDKALFYEKQVRDRHIRYGLYSDVTAIADGDLSTAVMRPHDSDNLWSGMYLVSQLFRYLVTGDAVAKANCIETFEAMERLHLMNDITGLFGRSFERTGIQEHRIEYRRYAETYWYPGYDSTVSWIKYDDEWDWRGSASSDQTVGQVFALSLFAEYMDEEPYRQRAVDRLTELMSYIVENDFNLIDFNGKPTLWGRWNPDYVNRFQTMVGDRKVCSSNIIAFIQAAYHFSGDEKFKAAAEYLMREHGYLENLMRPMREIGRVGDEADAWSKMLSNGWNHSDDEMYFLAYWCLYPYALNEELRTNFGEAIRDHWDIERPEKDALWNFCYAMTGAKNFDLEESIWHLQEFPLDMIQWETKNSHRKDLDFLPENFREQTTATILPPDERPDLKHNRNIFQLDRPDRKSELGAGDTFLLPYWMGRFLGVISEPIPSE